MNSSENPDMEGQEDYEEDNSYDYTESENPDNTQDISKLSEEAMKEMGYYDFEKETDRYPMA